MIDPTPYQDLVPRIVRKLNFPEHQRDEAHSEGLVVLVVAAQAYEPSYGVPPEAYLFMRLRWDLTSWRRRQHAEECLGDLDVPYDCPLVEHAHLTETLEACEHLSDKQYVALLGSALGYTQVELCRWLHSNGVGVKQLKTLARQRLTQMLGLAENPQVVANAIH